MRRNVLTSRHLAERLQWCQQRVTGHVPGGGQFSDECRFLLPRADGRTRVYVMLQTTRKVDRFGGGSVMLWARIHHGGRTTIVHVAGALTGIRYRDDIMQHHVIPHISFNCGILTTCCTC